MKSLYHFIIKPLDKRYDNIKKVGNKELIINSSIENHIFVSKKAVVVSTPAAYATKIKVGDEVYIHHNILRRYYDMKGEEKNSGTYFKDDLYFCSLDQIYMYNNTPHLNYCFVKPILNSSFLENRKEQPNVGIIKYTNNTLEALGIKLAIFDAFEILTRIQDEEDILNEKPKEVKENKAFKGFAEGRSK